MSEDQDGNAPDNVVGMRGPNELVVQLPESPLERELLTWWVTTAISDFTSTIPKALEYGGTSHRPGSADLRIIGQNLAELLEWSDVPDDVAQELGCWFYMQGKIARLISDYHHRRKGKDDTWFDSTIYTMMARRIQETGTWP